ncbi:hypothetical protein EZV73_21285 [Acidaminobacter sp. JC074]|uniref:MFS transporter n=1 Tax=Acidaminobacter sp. JC074 TaxID=2530199 RepID=UPI001F1127C5|nr:glycoside-pentoside-hexuronide (GPH):cation symporter [Acidaminobacter sp. JC074]MCH4890128.1 hypothetical protein [Acidaminobacter sp. JC074]
MTNKVITNKQMNAYALGIMGQAMIVTLVSSYIYSYFTNYVGINAIVVGTIFALVRLWDGINDMMMGALIDNTRTKIGKLRPYLYISAPIIFVTLVMLFNVPDLSMKGKVIWASVAYVLYSMAFTVCDVPFWTLTAVMTPNQDEKVALVSKNKAFNMLAHLIIGVGAVPAITFLGGGDSNEAFRIGIGRFSIVVGIVACLLILNTAHKVRENVNYTEDKPKLKESLKVLITNKPLLICVSVSFLGAILYGMRSMSKLNYAIYVMGDAKYMSLFTLFTVPFAILALNSVKYINKKASIEKKHLYIALLLIQAAINTVYYFVGYSNPYVILTFEGLIGYVNTISGIYAMVMLTRVAEYTFLQHGMNIEAMIFATRTFITKMTMGGAGLVLGLYMTFIGFDNTLEVQSSQTISGIFIIFTLLPALFLVINALIFSRFPITQAKLDELRKEEIAS